MTKQREQMTVFSVGAVVYALIELLWRQRTHWSMSLTGGVCFSILYNVYNCRKEIPMFKKCILGSAVITSVEFVVGIFVNVWQKWNVWDYSEMHFNVLGQICLLYSFLWFFLCIPISFVSKKLRTRLRGASPP